MKHASKHQKILSVFCLIFVFIVWWMITFCAIVGALHSPYTWLLLFGISGVLCYYAIKKHRIIGIILLIITLAELCLAFSHFEEGYCWQQGAIAEQQVKSLGLSPMIMVEKSSVSPAVWDYYAAYVSDPGTSINFTQNWKAHLDCHLNYSLSQSLADVFLNNWW